MLFIIPAIWVCLRYRRLSKLLRIQRLIYEGQVSDKNIRMYNKLAAKFKNSKRFNNELGKLIKCFESRGELNAVELYIVIVLAHKKPQKISHLVNDNISIVNYEHKSLLSGYKMNHINMQQRILKWLNNADMSTIDLERNMPYIQAKELLGLQEVMRQITWQAKRQIIIDKNNSFDFGQMYFSNFLNKNSISELTLYAEYDLCNFKARLRAFSNSNSEEFVEFTNTVFNLTFPNLPNWFVEVLEVNENSVYRAWFKIIYKQDRALKAILIEKHYKLISESKVKVDYLDFIAFELLLATFADTIVPLLNGKVKKVSFDDLLAKFNVMPQHIVDNFTPLFKYLNPYDKDYSQAWKLLLNEQISSKHNVHKPLNVFIKYYGLWPEFNAAVKGNISQKDYKDLLSYTETIKKYNQESELRQKFISDLNQLVDEKSSNIDFNFFYQHSQTAGMQELARVYSCFFKENTGEKNVVS